MKANEFAAAIQFVDEANKREAQQAQQAKARKR